MISTTETTIAGSGEIRTIHKRMVLPEELVDIVRSAECPIGIGHTANDEALPFILAYLIGSGVPVCDVVYYRSISRHHNPKNVWSLHTDQGKVLVLETPKGLKASVEYHVDIGDIPMIGARRKLLSVLGTCTNQKFSAAEVFGRQVTLIGDYTGVDLLVFVALEYFFEAKGARKVVFAGPKPKAV